jgi:hypothetical protein
MRVTACAAALLVGALAGCNSTALTPGEIVPAFIAASQSATRTMHMEWQGALTQPNPVPGKPGLPPDQVNVTFNGIFDFNGPDYAGTTESGSAAFNAGQTNYARVGGVAFIDFSGGGWQRASDFGQPPTEFDPMFALTADDVAYEAADTVAGRAVHRLRVLDPIAVVSRGLFGNGMFGAGPPTIAEGGQNDYLIYVDPSGIPVEAHMALDLALTVPRGIDTGDMPSAYQMRFDYTFSLWGEPLTISPPNLSNNGGGGGIDFPPRPRVQPNF